MMNLPSFDVSGMEGLAINCSFPVETELGPVPDCPSCSLRSEPAARRFKAAVAPRCGRPSLTAQGQARGPKQVKTCWPANLPCWFSRIGPVKPPVLCRFLVVRIEGQTGTGRNRFGSKGRN